MRLPLMMFTLSILFAVILSFSQIAQASSEPVKVPSIYDDGPGPAPIAAIKLESDEIASLMLLESVMDISSSAVLAGSCQSAEGSYSIEIFADGAINKPETNIVKITSPGNSEPLVLNAIIEAPDSFIGQNINILQAKNSKLKETLLSEYSGVATVNRELTLLSMHSRTLAQGQNNNLISYQGLLIKHFYEEQKPDNKNQYILGWGSASLSKEDFPANQFWVRFKALKVHGELKRMVLQEDRLIGTSSCRILIDSAAEIKKDNEIENRNNVVLKGIMTITRSQSYEDNPLAFEF